MGRARRPLKQREAKAAPHGASAEGGWARAWRIVLRQLSGPVVHDEGGHHSAARSSSAGREIKTTGGSDDAGREGGSDGGRSVGRGGVFVGVLRLDTGGVCCGGHADAEAILGPVDERT